MKIRSLTLAAVTAAGLLASSAVAQPPPSDKPVTEADTVGAAWANQDLDALIEIAGKLSAEGRGWPTTPKPPKPTVTAEQLYMPLINAAYSRKDKKALEKLIDELTNKVKRKDLAQKAQTALNLLGKSRAADPALSPDKLTPEQAEQLALFLGSIESAKVNMDPDALKELEAALPGESGLPAATVAALKKEIAAAAEGIPAEGDPTAKILRDLAAGSRAAMLTIGKNLPPAVGFTLKNETKLLLNVTVKPMGSSSEAKIQVGPNQTVQFYAAPTTSPTTTEIGIEATGLKAGKSKANNKTNYSFSGPDKEKKYHFGKK